MTGTGAGRLLEPHLHEGEHDLLRSEIARASSYLEFGCGGSTLLAVQSGARRIVSADSDAAWILQINEAIGPDHRDGIELIHCDIGRTRDWGHPVDREGIERWPRYVTEPWSRFLAKGELPDLVYIDGRFRVACALFSFICLARRRRLFSRAPRVMIHDFSNRPEYEVVNAYASQVANAKTLVVMQVRRDANLGRMLMDLMAYQFDPR